MIGLLLLVGVSPAKTKPRTASKKQVTSSTRRATAAKPSAKRVKSSSKKSAKLGRRVARYRGQQSIESARTREIQEALIRARYLDGEPSGSFDERTKSALRRLQGDNGWQTKVVPDSRALIKLGLGPTHEGLLNPESAVLGSPYELGTEGEIPGGALSH